MREWNQNREKKLTKLYYFTKCCIFCFLFVFVFVLVNYIHYLIIDTRQGTGLLLLHYYWIILTCNLAEQGMLTLPLASDITPGFLWEF